MEADMFSNDLNSAYEYERERRNDERRTAAESLQAKGLGKGSSPMHLTIAGILIVVVTLMYEL